MKKLLHLGDKPIAVNNNNINGDNNNNNNKFLDAIIRRLVL